MQLTSEVTTFEPQTLFYAFYPDRLDFDDEWPLNSSSPSYSQGNQSFFETATTTAGNPIAPFKKPQEYIEWEAARKLIIWVAPLLLVIGASGNGLSFFILRSCSFRKCSIAFTLSALALVDTSVLFTTLGRQWILYVTDGYDVRTLLWSFGCKVHFFLTYYLGQLSSWTLVVVTVERVVCVSMPFFARTACTKSRIALSWVLVAILLFVLNSHFFWTAEYFAVQVPTTTPNKTKYVDKCFIGWRYRDFFYHVWYWLDFSLLSIIPFVIIIVGNIVITICVVRAMNFRRQQTPVGTPSPSLTPSSIQSSNKPLTSSTAMLIGIGILFLVATTPSAVFFLLSDWWIGDGTDAHGIAKARLVYAATNLLHFANNALNFILYCLTGSRFRRAFVDHFRRKSSSLVEPKSHRAGAVFTVGTRTSNFVQATGNCEL